MNARILWLFIGALVATDAIGQLSFEVAPINYSTSKPSDPVAKLQEEIAAGKVKLQADDQYGYLKSLLEELKIPVSSQALVFSKTSLQRQHISPRNPRAIYFNDEIYVGWVPGAELIEIASTDPSLGTNFYVIEQDPAKRPAKLQRRTERCLFCHASSDTGRVPGLMMQSVFADEDGHRVFPEDLIWAKSSGPIQGRWAGWFVTGTHGKQSHLGNLMLQSSDSVVADELSHNGNILDLSKWVDTSKYLSPHSDLVALLVLQHQVEIHNLLTDTNHRSRKLLHEAAIQNQENARDETFLTDENKILLDQIAEQLVDGLLMVGSLSLTHSVAGSSDFAKEFVQRGPRDAQGRSLRDFDLQQRLLRYPCSYLIYADSFDALPGAIIARVVRRVKDVLKRRDTREKYAHVSSRLGTATMQILRETKAAFGESDD